MHEINQIEYPVVQEADIIHLESVDPFLKLRRRLDRSKNVQQFLQLGATIVEIFRRFTGFRMRYAFPLILDTSFWLTDDTEHFHTTD